MEPNPSKPFPLCSLCLASHGPLGQEDSTQWGGNHFVVNTQTHKALESHRHLNNALHAAAILNNHAKTHHQAACYDVETQQGRPWR